MANPEFSLKAGVAAGAVAAAPASAGEGVAGMAPPNIFCCEGAAGAAGVDAAAGAGVEGGFEADAAGAGAAFG
jgi:hypothetical protein